MHPHYETNPYKVEIYRGVEQLVARRAHNPEVRGSSPLSATKRDNSFGLSFFRILSLSQTPVCPGGYLAQKHGLFFFF